MTKNHNAVLAGENLKAIAGLYRFCAQSMKFPEATWLTPDYLACLYQFLENIGGLEQKRDLAQFFSLPSSPLEQLQIEYTRLFINGCPHVAAPPYASVYFDRSLQGQHTEKILSFYVSHGFLMAEDADLPDHIAHQLEFLALLVERGDQKAEAQFLSLFFLPWFQLFFPRVIHQSHHPFYKTIVHLIDYITKEEDQHGIQDIEA